MSIITMVIAVPRVTLLIIAVLSLVVVSNKDGNSGLIEIVAPLP